MTQEALHDLEQAIETFLAETAASVTSASRAIDPLLEIWGLAAAIGPSVAEPVERLLTALMGRQLVSGEELAETMNQVRAAAGPAASPVSV